MTVGQFSTKLLFLSRIKLPRIHVEFYYNAITKTNPREKTIEFTFNTAKERYPNFRNSIASFGSMVLWLAFIIQNGAVASTVCLYDIEPLTPSAVQVQSLI